MDSGQSESGIRHMSLVYDEVVRMLFGEEYMASRFWALCKTDLPNAVAGKSIPLEHAADIASTALTQFFELAKADPKRRSGAYLRTVIRGHKGDYWRRRKRNFLVLESDAAYVDEEDGDPVVAEYPHHRHEGLTELTDERLSWVRLLREWSKDPKLASDDIVQLVEALILVAPLVSTVEDAWCEATALLVARNGYGPEEIRRFVKRVKAQMNRKPWINQALCRDKRNPPNSSAAAKPTPAPASTPCKGGDLEAHVVHAAGPSNSE